MSKARLRFVDSHMHLWDAGANGWYGFPVPGNDFGMNLGMPKPFPNRFLMDNYLDALSAVDVAKCVHVTAVGAASDVEAESAWIAQIASEHGLPTALIGTVDVEGTCSEIEATLDREMRNPAYRGIRILAGMDYGSQLADVVLRALVKRGLVYDAVAHPGGIAALADALRRHEDLVAILEHTGWPLSADAATFHRWRDEMAVLAELPNALCKLSGLAMFVHRTDPEIFRRYFETALSFFGADRCMFGSNFPVDFIYGGFRELLAVFQSVADGCTKEETQSLFCGTAERAYRL